MVLRFTYRVRRERIHFIDVVCVAKLAKHLQSFYRLRYSGLFQVPFTLHILREPYGFLKLVVNYEMCVVDDMREYKSRGIRA